MGATALIEHFELRELRKKNVAYRDELKGAIRTSRENAAEPPTLPRKSDMVTLPENPSSELLRLRGEVWVLRRAVAEAGARSASSQADPVEVRRQGFERALEVLESRFSEEQQREIVARRKLEELEATLAVPENITNLDLAACLNDPNLRPYQPYFTAKEELKSSESSRLLVQTIEAYVRADSHLPVGSPSSP